MKNKKGFTLIELLAVIVILAIIALIATPLILGVINDSRRDSLKTSAYGILSAAELEVAKNMNNLENYSTSFGTSRTGTEPVLSFKGKEPKSGKVFVGKDGSEQIVISDGTWCAYKYDNKNDVKVVKNGAKENGELICDEEKISEKEPIDYSKCFEYTEKSNGAIKITGLTNDFSCFEKIEGDYPTYVFALPSQIQGKNVDEIGDWAFHYGPFTGDIIIPDTVINIGDRTFGENGFKGKIVLGKNVESIGSMAFWYFEHTSTNEIVLPSSLKNIGEEAFNNHTGLNSVVVEYSTAKGTTCDRFKEKYPEIFKNSQTTNLTEFTSANITCRESN